MRESKECLECGGIYFRPIVCTDTQWEARKYCGVGCANKARFGERRLKKEAEQKVETVTPAVIVEPIGGIERELKVIRVGPNPRLVSCEYWELESRRTCVVNVKDNRKYMRGMVLRLQEPDTELGLARPWVYVGKAPRRKGRW